LRWLTIGTAPDTVHSWQSVQALDEGDAEKVRRVLAPRIDEQRGDGRVPAAVTTKKRARRAKGRES
jgi:hypothetical protein